MGGPFGGPVERGITAPQARTKRVKQLLAGCDRRSAPSRRDYAILALLVRMGILAVEVTRLQLEDIDWRVGNLVVCGKGRWTETLPLPTNVGTLLPPTSRHSSDSPERRCPVRLSQ